MTSEAKAACVAVGAHLAMYAWWIWADALLSDDYYMFATSPNFRIVTTEMFRPLGAIAADALSAWLQSSPGAVYWVKGLSIGLSSLFVGTIAVSFARITGAPAIGIAMSLLVSTNPGTQINTIWLCTVPIWSTHVVTAMIFYGLVAAREWSPPTRWSLVAVLCLIMAISLLMYQMAPFLLAGIVAAYVVLSHDDRRSLARLVVPAGIVCVVAMCAYLLALWIASSSGLVAGGRAGGALSGLLSRLTSVQPQQGMFWLNLFLTAPQSAVCVAIFVSLGASLDILRNGRERALRWGAAVLLTAAALCTPAALNDFQAARLYAPGSIGVAGLLIASALAINRQLPSGLWPAARHLAMATGLFLLVSSQAAGVIGLALNQHAELQYVRTQIAQAGIANVVQVHLIPPPEDSAFWAQPIRDPRHDMYTVRLSSYHPWAREGLVRFALRYVDPGRRLKVTVGNEMPDASPSVAVVDMRPANRALFDIPF